MVWHGGDFKKLLTCLLTAFAVQFSCPHHLQFVEMFAGVGAITSAMQGFGYKGKSMDKEFCVADDLLTWCGLLKALWLVSQVQKGGVVWLAPPCGNFVWMSRYTTKRSMQNPLGQGANAELANKLVSRVCLIVYFCTCIGVNWVIEQPGSSLLWEHPDVAGLLADLPHRNIQTQLGAFGANNVKTLVLVGSVPCLQELQRTVSRSDRARIVKKRLQCGLARRFTDHNGRTRCTGNSNLTLSSAYTRHFGLAVADLFHRHWQNHADPGSTVTADDVRRAMHFFSSHDEHVFDDIWAQMSSRHTA